MIGRLCRHIGEVVVTGTVPSSIRTPVSHLKGVGLDFRQHPGPQRLLLQVHQLRRHERLLVSHTPPASFPRRGPERRGLSLLPTTALVMPASHGRIVVDSEIDDLLEVIDE